MRTVAVVLLAGGCLVVDGPKGQVFSAEIGPDGGELAGGGMTLTVPAGALSTVEELSVRVVDRPAPDGSPSLSPVYTFAPAGLVFADAAHVAVEIDGGGIGTLLWSTLDDPNVYEPIGLAAGGLGEGTTTHFSTMFVGEGACVAPTTVCTCRATDEQGDLLCPEDPSTGAPCDVDGYSGTDGAGCSGFGPRPEIVSWCDCESEDYGYLCPDPMAFEPYQHCPSENGLNGFHGAPGDACSGYTVDNEQLSGTIRSCSTETADTTYRSIGGILEGCYETSPPATARTATASRCSTANLSWEQECLDVLDGYGPDRTEACPDLGEAEAVGSKLGAKLEEAWRASGPGRLTQVEVPYANKEDCKTGMALEERGVGKPDLMQVVMETEDAVLVRVGDIKPLTRSGLDLGWKEVNDCYLPAVAEAGRACSKPAAQRDAAEAAFCRQLGVDGKRVELDEEPGVQWDLGAWPPAEVYTCTEGVVAYTCP